MRPNCDLQLRRNRCTSMNGSKQTRVGARCACVHLAHNLISSRGNCSATPGRERKPPNFPGLGKNVGASSEAGNGTAKSPCYEFPSGLPFSCQPVTACIETKCPTSNRSRHDVFLFLLFWCGSNSFSRHEFEFRLLWIDKSVHAAAKTTNIHSRPFRALCFSRSVPL